MKPASDHYRSSIINAQHEKNYGYYLELSKAKTKIELKEKLYTIITRLGYTDYFLINLDCTEVLQYGVNTLPRLLVEEYYGKRLYLNDMVLQRAMNKNTEFYSSVIYDYIEKSPFVSDMTKSMNEIYNLYKRFGFYEFLHFPFCNDGVKFLFSVSERGATPLDIREKIEDSKRSLALLCEAIVAVIMSRFNDLIPLKNTATQINKKPLRVLNALANNDLNIGEVAKKLGISTITANQHLKNARTCLGARTNYAAIKRAVLEGLVKLDETLK